MKTILKSMKEIIITSILSYLIIIIACIIYTAIGHSNIDYFLSHSCAYILIIYYLITIIYLYQKNLQPEQSLPKSKYYPLLSLGVSLSVLLNMLIFKMTNPQPTNTLPLYLTIISTGIIGPIYEEILFRYLLYNRLKKTYHPPKAIFLTTTIFALTHLNPIKIIYAFILGLAFNIIYEKENSILAPIIIHTSANIMSIFLFEYNTYALFLSLIIFLISIKLLFSKGKN